MHIRRTKPITPTDSIRPLFDQGEWNWICQLAKLRRVEPEAMVVILTRIAMKHIAQETRDDEI